MKNFVKKGDTLTVPAPAGGVVSGAAVLIGTALFGVAVTDAAAGEDVELKTSGVFDLPKAAGAAWAIGDALFWDAAAKNLTKTAGGNTRAAVAVAAALSADTAGTAKIGPVVG